MAVFSGQVDLVGLQVRQALGRSKQTAEGTTRRLEGVDDGAASQGGKAGGRPMTDIGADVEDHDVNLAGDPGHSTIALERGLDTMPVVAAAHRSAAGKRAVHIDYAKGYSPEALTS